MKGESCNARSPLVSSVLSLTVNPAQNFPFTSAVRCKSRRALKGPNAKHSRTLVRIPRKDESEGNKNRTQPRHDGSMATACESWRLSGKSGSQTVSDAKLFPIQPVPSTADVLATGEEWATQVLPTFPPVHGGAEPEPSPSSVRSSSLQNELSSTGLLLEPWNHPHLCDLPLAERVAVARTQGGRINPITAARLETVPMSRLAELEIFAVWFIWMCMAMITPLFFLSLPFLPLVLSPESLAATFAVAGVAAVLCLYPHRTIETPSWTRWSNPLHNRTLGTAFMRYFPMRCILEDDTILDLQADTGLILGGLPHGLFPIGMLVLSICGFALPFRALRGATASAILRLPIWRQVLRWNGGIDVSRESITTALAEKSNVVVAMDGIGNAVQAQHSLSHGHRRLARDSLITARVSPRLTLPQSPLRSPVPPSHFRAAGMFACCPPHSFKDQREAYLIRRRKGLCRIALETGSPLVPFVMFGNTKCVAPVADPFGVMEFLSRRLGVSLIWASGRCGLPVPHRTPVTIVIGRPLAIPTTRPAADGSVPTEEQVSTMHAQLVSEMTRMYERWQDVAGYGGVQLEVM